MRGEVAMSWRTGSEPGDGCASRRHRHNDGGEGVEGGDVEPEEQHALALEEELAVVRRCTCDRAITGDRGCMGLGCIEPARASI